MFFKRNCLFIIVSVSLQTNCIKTLLRIKGLVFPFKKLGGGRHGNTSISAPLRQLLDLGRELLPEECGLTRLCLLHVMSCHVMCSSPPSAPCVGCLRAVLVVLSDTGTSANKGCLFSHLELGLYPSVLHNPLCSSITAESRHKSLLYVSSNRFSIGSPFSITKVDTP